MRDWSIVVTSSFASVVGKIRISGAFTEKSVVKMNSYHHFIVVSLFLNM